MQTISGLEAKVEAEIFQALKAQIGNATDIWNLIPQVFGLLHGKSYAEVGSRNNIIYMLTNKLANDIHATVELFLLGYPEQAASVACSGWELGWLIKYICLADDQRVEEWFQHASETKSFHGNLKETIRFTSRRIYPALTEAELDAYFVSQDLVWIDMCKIRHGNPQTFFPKVVSNLVLPTIGPQGGERTIRAGRIILFHLLVNSCQALAEWLKLHGANRQSEPLVYQLRDIVNSLQPLAPYVQTPEAGTT
ncbi:hypothetical protein ACFSM5_11310 [Lacibacterium aquatile]|uniref:Uncharacterized protein n=1 Tax=Lacibacterium aquatile TaxID=1168082 RepID=A0ABW5DS91_9PROT